VAAEPILIQHRSSLDLATLARNTIITAITPNYPLTVLTRATPIQQKAFHLLGIKCSQ
jgi:hypothetical protein